MSGIMTKESAKAVWPAHCVSQGQDDGFLSVGLPDQ